MPLFQDWFVDFGPTRAKLAGRAPYLPPELWDLFPARLVDSELGEIPEGWEVTRLANLCHKPQYGYTASANDTPVGPKFLRITDINKTAWINWQSVPYCAITDKDFQKYRIRTNDILVARMADPGHGIMIEEDEEDAVFASYLIRFRPRKEQHCRLLQYWLRSGGYWNLVRERGVGTTRLSINAKILGGFPLIIPPEYIASAFGDQINSLRDRVVKNVADSRTLSTMRDTLLPKLVSGEVKAL